MNIVYITLFITGISIVVINDKSITDCGFEKEKLKTDIIISLIIIIITFIVVAIFSEQSLSIVIKQALYYLFYIAAIEEILFRGVIQNYLFGFKLNRYVIFIIGALLFSFSHIPFQMFVHNNVSLDYFAKAIPNLIETFIAHLVYCFIANKRKNLMIPIALHYAYDFLGVIM